MVETVVDRASGKTLPKKLRVLPWEGAEKGKYPWQLRHWFADPKQGCFTLCNDLFEIRIDDATGQKTVVPLGIQDQNPRQLPIVTYSDVQATYKLSAAKGIPLMAAFVEHRGTEHIAPSLVEQFLDCTVQYADPKYAPPAEPVPQKRRPGRPRKNPEPVETD